MKFKLSDEQQKIILHESGALCVHRRPYSGTATALVERARHLATTQKGSFGILVLTFVRAIRDQYSQQFEGIQELHNRVSVKTFHDFCKDVISKHGRTIGIDTMPDILSEREQYLVLRDVSMDMMSDSSIGDEGDYAVEIVTAKEALQTPELLDNLEIRHVYENYEVRLRSMGAIDQHDLALLTYRIFRESPYVAEFYRKQYRHIWMHGGEMPNEAQYQVLRALCGESHRHVILAGDPRQKGFRRPESWSRELLERFVQDFGAETVELKAVYSSSREIVRAMRRVKSDVHKGVEFPIIGEVRLLVANNEEHEAQLVLQQIEELMQKGHPDLKNGFSLERCTVVGRNRYVLEGLENELKNRGWHYEFPRNIQRESDLMEQFRLSLQIVHDPENLMAWRNLLHQWGISNVPEFYNGDSGWERIQRALKYRLNPEPSNRHAEAVLDALKFLLDKHAVRFDFANALDLLHVYARTLNEIERDLAIRDLLDWQQQWGQFLRGTEEATLAPFLQYMARSTKRSTSKKDDTLSLNTVHTLHGHSRGREYDVVFLMGMMQGVFPDTSSPSRTYDEERMLLLHAMSKARRLLYFSYPMTRVEEFGQDKTWRQEPSEFLKLIKLV